MRYLMVSLNHGYGLTLNSVYYELIWSPLCKSNITINSKCIVHILQRSMLVLIRVKMVLSRFGHVESNTNL